MPKCRPLMLKMTFDPISYVLQSVLTYIFMNILTLAAIHRTLKSLNILVINKLMFIHFMIKYRHQILM